LQNKATGEMKPPDDLLNGLEKVIFGERDRKLAEARLQRQQNRLAQWLVV